MPAAAPKPCASPGCPALVTGARYCSRHTGTAPNAHALYDATRRRSDAGLAQAAEIRSSARWQRFRHWYRARHPICCDPFSTHGAMAVPMAQVHHVIPLAQAPHLACVEDNCRPLCTGCHARIEAMERRGETTAEIFAGL